MTAVRTFRYRVVDVFTTEPLQGNALAVFPNASGIDDVTMQKIARELNLPETTFVLPATQEGCAAQVRIFTPAKEMLFAGHPTIGTGFVMLEEGLVQSNDQQFVLEEKVGPVPVSVEAGEPPMLWLRTPTIAEGAFFDRSECARALGLTPADLLEIKPQLLNAGNPTLVIPLKDRTTVDRAWLDVPGLKTLTSFDQEPFCVYVFAATPAGAYSRMFAPAYGIPEDPASGSCMGPLVTFMIRRLLSGASGTRFISEQGTKMGRRSILHVRIRGGHGTDGIEVGGHVTPIAEGKMTVPVGELIQVGCTVSAATRSFVPARGKSLMTRE